MAFNAKKWIPLTIVIAPCFLLLENSNTKISQPEPVPPIDIPLPEPPAEYVPPQKLRDPFVFKETEAEVAVSTVSAVNPKLKKPKGPPPVHIELQGILWTQSAPLVSINGKLLGEGSRLKDIVVVKIYPNKVLLRINNKPVIKYMSK